MFLEKAVNGTLSNMLNASWKIASWLGWRSLPFTLYSPPGSISTILDPSAEGILLLLLARTGLPLPAAGLWLPEVPVNKSPSLLTLVETAGIFYMLQPCMQHSFS